VGGQKPVKADWSKLSPTKVVNSNHQGLTSKVSPTLRRMKTPARARMKESTFMINYYMSKRAYT
jgi:hypothetical protein